MCIRDRDGNGQIQISDFNAALATAGQSGYMAADLNMDGEVQTSELVTILLQLIGKGVQF